MLRGMAFFRFGMTLFFGLVASSFRAVGYDSAFDVRRTSKNSKPQKGEVNLNVGAGAKRLRGFRSVDNRSRHYHGGVTNFFRKTIQFDLRKDNLPYPGSAVQNIYCSHVLEHVEEQHVERFLREASRVLKPGGTLRIAVPDARFLFNVSRINSDYWSWNSVWSVPGSPREKRLHPFDCLVQELVTSRFRFLADSHSPLKPSDFENLSYDEAIQLLWSEVRLFPDKPNYHVSTWDFFSLEKLAKSSGFSTVLESKVRGSVSSRMQAVGFDTTHPEMTLYVDCVKGPAAVARLVPGSPDN